MAPLRIALALAGSLAMIALTGLVLFQSGKAIETFLSWSVGYLSLVYLVFVIWSFVAFGDRITANLAAEPVGHGWLNNGQFARASMRRGTATTRLCWIVGRLTTTERSENCRTSRANVDQNAVSCILAYHAPMQK